VTVEPRRARGSDAPDPDLADVRAAQRDRAAFGALYRRYLDRVYGYCFYLLGDHHDAEDATERTFVAALAAIDGYRDEGATFRAWLFRIAHNQLANTLRARHRQHATSLEVIAEPRSSRTRPGSSASPRRPVGCDARSTSSPTTAARSSSSASSTDSPRGRSAPSSAAARAPSGYSSIGPSVSWPSCSRSGATARRCNVPRLPVLAEA